MSDATSRPELETLKDRLNYLFETVRPHGKPRYSVRDVADAIAGDQDVQVSVTPSYIHYLCTGERDNPGVRQLVAIARFFGVPAAFLLGEGDVDSVARDLAHLKAAVELKEAMSDPEVAQFAIKARGLSSAMLHFVAAVLEQAHELGSQEHDGDRAGERTRQHLVVVDARAPRYVQDHILTHEVSHILCNHQGNLDIDHDALPLLSLDPAMVRRVLGRTRRYPTPAEHEAEILASVIVDTARNHRAAYRSPDRSISSCTAGSSRSATASVISAATRHGHRSRSRGSRAERAATR